jgi:hypothetical protein
MLLATYLAWLGQVSSTSGGCSCLPQGHWSLYPQLHFFFDCWEQLVASCTAWCQAGCLKALLWVESQVWASVSAAHILVRWWRLRACAGNSQAGRSRAGPTVLVLVGQTACTRRRMCWQCPCSQSWPIHTTLKSVSPQTFFHAVPTVWLGISL